MNGIVVLNKPAGISSNLACKKVGRILGEKKVGHLGTLDPMAEGVLPITLGKCTKLFDYYLKKDKSYIADFTFGIETDTLDKEGNITREGGYIPTIGELMLTTKSMIGEQSQLPPKFSAKKVNGKRAYDLARANLDFQLIPKNISIYEFDYLSKVNDRTFQFRISCSSGTYIRSIARDLAYKLNTFAYMSNLVRIKCGEFRIEDAVTLDNVNCECVLTLDEIFKEHKKITIDNEQSYNEFINTGRVRVHIISDDTSDYVLMYKDNIISKGILDNGYYVNRIRFI